MSTGFTISVWKNGALQYRGELAAPLLIGRQDPSRQEPDPLATGGRPVYVASSSDTAPGTPHRLIITHARDTAISRTALYVESRADGLALENRGTQRQAYATDQGNLGAGQRRLVPHAITVSLGADFRIELRNDVAEHEEYHSLPHATRPPSSSQSIPRQLLDATNTDTIDPASLTRWLQTTLEILEGALRGEAVYQRAAEAACALVQLDSARILLHHGQDWTPCGAVESSSPRERPWSRRLLAKMRAESRTVWKQPGGADSLLGTLGELDAAIASPILSGTGEIVGAIYGQRVTRGGQPALQQRDAMVLELLARLVAASLASRDLNNLRVRFDQFFTRDLSRRLLDDPALLKGRETLVTILFCDIRKFSSISGRLDAETLGRWIRDVMDTLSAQILAQAGVVVDYIGDEVLAMWGAPEPCDQHAELACRAALGMFAALPELNARWAPVLGEPFSFGIGIHTGRAQVGNTGSNQRFKYGPLGATVNLASRVQGATKLLRTPILLTSATHDLLTAGNLATRRLGAVRAVNIPDPVELFELSIQQPAPEDWRGMAHHYETALARYRTGDFREALDQSLQVLRTFPEDGPALNLVERAVPHILDPSLPFEPVWDLKSK